VKVATQEIENRQVVLDIVVEDEQVEKAVDQAYRRIVQRLNVPGFRKGKAPRALVERMVGKEALLEDAMEHLVPRVVQDAVKQQDLKMVARPTLEVVSTQPLQVKATVPVEPKVELGDYRSLSVPLEEPDVDDDQVEGVVERLREANATWEPVERPVRLGDRVAIDVTGKVGETVIVDSKDAEYVVDPEGPQPAVGFADEIVELQPEEEKTFTLTLPEDWRNKEQAGQEATFTVRVHWVKEKKLPELDDAFASTVGDDYETMEALRAAIRKDLTDRQAATLRNDHADKVLEAVVEQAKVEVPPQLVQEEADRILQEYARSLEQQGIPLQQFMRLTNKTEESLRAEMLAQGEKNVRRTEVLNAVADAEGIEVSDEQVRDELLRDLSDAPNAERLVRDALKREGVRDRVAAIIRRRQAARILMQTVGGIDPDAEDAADGAATDEVEREIVADETEAAEAVGATSAPAEQPGEARS
jgi:trigger factor